VLAAALLVLLAERESHGYELAGRLSEIGIVADKGALYRMLRAMDRSGEVRSFWDASSRGPARRVYAPTEEGLGWLRVALARMEEHGTTVGRLLHRAHGELGLKPQLRVQ
jgi:DNA-binding PadR family transcriptional regulator